MVVRDVTRELRRAVLAAGSGEWTPEASGEVEAVLIATAALHDSIAEIGDAASQVPRRAETRLMHGQLERCVKAMHHEALKMALRKLDTLSLPEKPIHAIARELVRKLDVARAALKAAVASVVPAELHSALRVAKEIGLVHYEQPAAEQPGGVLKEHRVRCSAV